jgi:Rrf2 family transcriptional regulator, cysteine metabolism repressor
VRARPGAPVHWGDGRVGARRAVITITERSRSAVSALTELARRGGTVPVPIQEVSEARGIALHVLEQLFSALRRAGVLQSQRGVKGGYSFRRPPREVTILEVVEAVDGPLTPPEAASRPAAAGDALWMEARERLAALLRETTVADVLDREARLAGAPMFHI